MRKTYIYPTNKVYTIALHEMLAGSLTHGTEDEERYDLNKNPSGSDTGDGDDLSRQSSGNSIWDNQW